MTRFMFAYYAKQPKLMDPWAMWLKYIGRTASRLTQFRYIEAR